MCLERRNRKESKYVFGSKEKQKIDMREFVYTPGRKPVADDGFRVGNVLKDSAN
jgi:hypothetical protein